MRLKINGIRRDLDIDPQMPLLWVLRDYLDLRATKFGCGGGHCGACTVHVDGQAVRSCLTPVSELENAEITTFEGLDGPIAEAVHSAWQDAAAVQCGYCQYGQIMTATALLATTPDPDDAEIIDEMDGNLCRCGTYPRIRQAVRLAADRLREG